MFKASNFKLSEPYENFLYQVLDLIQKDLRVVKKSMSEQKIKIAQEDKKNGFVPYHIYFRGYDRRRELWDQAIKVKVNEYMKHYFSSVRKISD